MPRRVCDAGLRQHDAERPRGDDGILEKLFVEIAHAVGQQAIGIGRLDCAIIGVGESLLLSRAMGLGVSAGLCMV
ncbi:hypothetical protein, partial [Rhodoblastus sp.]|uniref:hypothetical protein n=1 Tax=Rhodoblastus sp. TaxID=1962975 RepID=UPI003F97F1B9